MKFSPFLCIRSLDIAQASPFLGMAWRIIKNESPDSLLILKDQPKCLPPSIDDAVVENHEIEFQSEIHFRSVISWSIPNERTIEDITMLEGVDTIPGPVGAVYKLSDKRTTKMLFEQFSLPTPKWEVLDREFTHGELLKESFRDKIEYELVSHLFFPIVLKPLWDCMGHGVEIIINKHELVDKLKKNERKNLLIESFIDGMLGCIEILGVPGGYYFQPPCFTGKSSNGVRSDFDTIRACHPIFFKEQLNKEVKIKLGNLLNYLKFSGACCVDFIVKGGNIYFLEINPRISGISCLSSAASGVNSFEATYLISSGQWNCDVFASNTYRGAALQIGGVYADEVIPIICGEGDKMTVFRDEIIIVDGKRSRNIIAGGKAESVEKVLKSVNHASIDLITYG